MAKLEALLNDLANLDAQHDLDGMRRVRELIIDEHPGTDAAVEALYKLGLDQLFRERNVEAAVAKFEDAAKRKHPFWSAAARTSLGLCLYHQKRVQKALFELRKVAHPDEPNAHSVTALAFIENICVAEGQVEDAKRARKERIGQLEALAAQARDHHRTSERAYYLYSLGMALRDHGEQARARAVLEEARDLGPDAVGHDLFRSISSALV